MIHELIKVLDEKLEIYKLEKDEENIYIYCNTKKMKQYCPYCTNISENVHSKYTRTIADLPIQNYKVKLIINVKKYFCNNKNCKHTTFAEPLEFVAKNAIRTKRLDDYINKVGLFNSSLTAQKQLADSHIKISNNTILRVVKKTKNT